jgi:hypothetical protein
MVDLPRRLCQGGEMVDTHGLGPCAERLGGSSPLLGTGGIFITKLWQRQY